MPRARDRKGREVKAQQTVAPFNEPRDSDEGLKKQNLGDSEGHGVLPALEEPRGPGIYRPPGINCGVKRTFWTALW